LKREEGEQLVKAALGLTLNEAENAFAKAIAENDRLDGSDIQRVMEEKRQVIRKSGLLEYYPVEHALGAVGGLQNLKDWLHRRARAFSAEARAFGLPEPRGLLLLGVQGCGKSLTAKAIASQWALPLLRLDMGRVFSGLIGSSEENLRRAIRVAESAAPAVLWLDEIDKALSGSASSGLTDGGTTARVLGTFLTWLQEKTVPVFVVATANRVEGLPPELLRKGRFDEIFFIDLPDALERAEILRIHLRRRGRDPATFDLPQLAARSDQFSGAELEQVVVEGLHEAFSAGTELRDQHLLRAIAETVPLAVTLREEVARVRDWSRDRTRPASRLAEEPGQ
jgi:SpoVK/Ycf46/Vps4 family AAA+-type ATPase